MAERLVYDPSSYAQQADPYPVYRRMLEEAPLYRNEDLDFWALTRFEDVAAGLNDPLGLSSAQGTLIEQIRSDSPAPDMIIFMDPPRHDLLRKIISKAFTPRRIAQLEGEIRAACQVWLEEMDDTGGGDLVEAFAGRLPSTVIAKLLGAPDEDHARLKQLSDRLLHRDDGSLSRPEDAQQAGAELAGYFYELITARRTAPADDLASALIEAKVEGPDGAQQLNDGELIFFCLLLGVAGNETTAKMISTGAVLLAEHPDQRKMLVADPSQWSSAVEEMLRFDPPSHYQGRVTTRPTTWNGTEVPEGAVVLLVNGAANRDPRVFDDPDSFRIGRTFERHLAFGHGVHFCLGSSLARLETRVALEELVRRFPGYAVDTSAVERAHSSNVRGLSRVPITTCA
ncbi:cytochrome P450 [Humibacter sp.]|uniref:cytochrome P450 n=1 Tax=Humibacter sp. TaxID=1940291 RepID=UPI002B7B80A2|nr:cytochrome P450 [Humibacter sp.]HVX09175.1 cytochrome P450 [Humibacter sp.]